MKKLITLVLGLLLSLCLNGAMAGEKANEPLADATLTGKLVKVEQMRKAKDGTEKAYVRWYLEDAKGVKTPIAKNLANKKNNIKLEDGEGKQVELQAQVMKKSSKKKGEYVVVKKLVSMKVAEEKPAATE